MAKQAEPAIIIRDPRSVTRQEFVKAFREILDLVNSWKKEHRDIIDAEKKRAIVTFENIVSRIVSETSEEINDLLKTELINTFQEFLDKNQAKLDREAQKREEDMNLIRDKVRKIKEGKDGKDADEEAIIERLLTMLPNIPDEETLFEKFSTLIPEIPEFVRDTPADIANKLEELKGDERLKISAIDQLDERLSSLEKRPIAKGGGGTSAIGVAQTFKYIAHTEEPSGALDGVNTTYTVSNTIWWVAGFTLNNAQIAELPNFTYAGKTITFSSPLPSAFSGKDFEIKYIGT